MRYLAIRILAGEGASAASSSPSGHTQLQYQGLIKLLGADRVVFGSDYPHPEGMSNPVDYVDELEGLPRDDIAKVMGGNLAEVVKVGAAV